MSNRIAFIDLETTGLDVKKDRIVEIAIVIRDFTDDYLPELYEDHFYSLVNPIINIPDEAAAIHGINNLHVSDAPIFSHIVDQVYNKITSCDNVAGFNSNGFDLKMLNAEFERCGVTWHYHKQNLIDVGNMYKQVQPRTLTAAHREYVNNELAAHGALADAVGTANVFTAMMRRHDEIPKDVKELALYSNFGKPILDLSGWFSLDADGDYIFNYGKYRTKKAKHWKEYLQWMIKSDFANDTKDICVKILEHGN